jgi:hypothetical protein
MAHEGIKINSMAVPPCLYCRYVPTLSLRCLHTDKLQAKVVGPAMSIYLTNKTANTSNSDLILASQIINQIALGPLVSATLSFANRSSPLKQAKEQLPMQSVENSSLNPSNSYAYQQIQHPLPPRQQATDSPIFTWFLRLLHPVIMVGLVLGIIGGVDRAPDSSTGQVKLSGYQNGITMSKISSILFLLAIISLFGVVCLRYLRRWSQNLGRPSRSIKSADSPVIPDPVLLILVIPLLLIRVLYTTLYSFDLDKNDTSAISKFDQAHGSWVIYLFLAFIPQIAVLTAYASFGMLGWRRARADI